VKELTTEDTEKAKRISHENAQEAQSEKRGVRLLLVILFVPLVPFCG
jgi:hypothetical protein